MHDLRPNDRCPCGSGKKVKKCCPERLIRPLPAPVPERAPRQQRSFVSSREAMPVPQGVESWPVVRAYVPVPDAWRATGVGTAGIVREQPDGRQAYAFFVIELLEHGLKSTFGKYDASPADLDSMVASLSEMIPPMEEGSPETAAKFIWGARAVADAEGCAFPPDDVAPYFALVPRPPGSARNWLEQLVGRGGLTPPDLVRVIRAHPMQDDVPDGKEVMIVTTMTFDLTDAAAVVDVLMSADPEFIHSGMDCDAEVFNWTRKYPKKHWSPLARFGGRQNIGTVHIEGRTLVAEAQTLSMSARLTQRLLQLLGERIKLRNTSWSSMNDLLAPARVAQVEARASRSLPPRRR